MSEEISRALAANGSTTVTIAGKECTVRPLGIKELSEVNRLCLQWYKRQYLSTFADNASLLPEGRGTELLEKKMEEAAKWDVGDLPPQAAYDPDRVKLSEELKRWLVDKLNVKGECPDEKLRRMAATVLDQGMLGDDEYEKMVGTKPPKVKVPYSNWWVTGHFDGMIDFVWVCFRSQGVTREQIMDEMRGDMSLLINLTREIERLSAPDPKNG